MKALILSDIHSNLEALSAVIQAAGRFDEIWSLGDLVGYGPDPAAVIDLLRDHSHRAVIGNHDLACVGKLPLRDFNPYAAAANLWTSQTLDAERKAYLAVQPGVLELDDHDFTLVHGSPRDPVWEYVVSAYEARAAFNYMETDRCLLGHTHVPIIFREVERGRVELAKPRYGAPYPLDAERLIINPGSVGQPRDYDPRAAFALYDSDAQTITHHRVQYDIPATQRKMADHNLPDFLIDRLSIGY